MLHYIYRHRMANAKCGTVAVLSLMPVHDWSEDYASSVSSPVINRIPVSLSLSLRPASFPSLPYFSAICAVMLHYIYRHRMANACSGTVPVLSLMLVHDWREDYASFVSSPVINRISVIFGLSLRPPLRGTTKKDLAGASQSQPDDGDRVAARCLSIAESLAHATKRMTAILLFRPPTHYRLQTSGKGSSLRRTCRRIDFPAKAQPQPDVAGLHLRFLDGEDNSMPSL